MRRLPITSLGLSILATSALSYALGWSLGWIEFVVVAVGCAIALLLGLPFIVGGHPLQLEREVEPDRVSVGDEAFSVLKTLNGGKRPSAPRRIEDSVGYEGQKGMRFIDVPALGAGESSTSRTRIPTTKRGVVEVGPAAIVKADPLRLFRRDLGRSGQKRLFVRPRVVPLTLLRSGFAKDLEGPTFDSSPAGDIAFHAVREYAQGDNVRHIHWMSTARKGTLMVKHYVDNRRPFLGVIVDDDPDALSPERFEVAIEIAASQIVSADRDGRPIAVWVGANAIDSSSNPATGSVALDRLCEVTQPQDASPISASYQSMRLADRSVSALVIITGDRAPEQLLPVVNRAKSSGNVIVVRVAEIGDAAAAGAVPGARTVTCATLDEFAGAWGALTR